MKDQDHNLDLVNQSGFPYQLRIELEILESKSKHNWSIASHEHPWRNPDGDSSGFIDLVLQHDQAVVNRLVIECKRVKSVDRRMLQWLFLIPEGTSKPIARASCLQVARSFTKQTQWKDTRLWEDVKVIPLSPESEFCILVGDTPNKQTILEARCSSLLDAMEGLAEEEVKSAHFRSDGNVRLFIFPVIVTNARIMACLFKPGDINIADGTLDVSQLKVEKQPFIRFRKSLATKFPEGAQSLRDAHAGRERTVFVVNGEEGLLDFLKEFRVSPTSRRFAIEQYLNSS